MSPQRSFETAPQGAVLLSRRVLRLRPVLASQMCHLRASWRSGFVRAPWSLWIVHPT